MWVLGNLLKYATLLGIVTVRQNIQEFTVWTLNNTQTIMVLMISTSHFDIDIS